MNTPPKPAVRVDYQDLALFVSTAAQAVGLPREKATLLGDLLAGNDLKGVFSHGTRQIETYASLMREGTLNNRPELTVVRETPQAAVVDGDGGLSYFPSHQAMSMAIAKAETGGMAITQTRNHGHFGAAGLYARMAVDRGLMAFVTSGHQLNLQDDDSIFRAAGGSPMAFCVPCGKEDPVVLDFGAMHDLYANDPHRDDVARLAPGLVLRSIGLGEICQAWGGLLSGLSVDGAKPRWTYPGANQGALFVVFQIGLFRDPDEMRAEMDEYVRRVRGLKPFPGVTGSYMPGGIELARERRWRAEGVPVGADHRRVLDELALELEIPAPW